MPPPPRPLPFATKPNGGGVANSSQRKVNCDDCLSSWRERSLSAATKLEHCVASLAEFPSKTHWLKDGESVSERREEEKQQGERRRCWPSHEFPVNRLRWAVDSCGFSDTAEPSSSSLCQHTSLPTVTFTHSHRSHYEDRIMHTYAPETSHKRIGCFSFTVFPSDLELIQRHTSI